MALHRVTQLANGTTFSVTEVPAYEPSDTYFNVERRDRLGTFVRVEFSSFDLDECHEWVADHINQHGYSLKVDEPASTYIHPLDRRRDWCASERDDALADLNAHLERQSHAS